MNLVLASFLHRKEWLGLTNELLSSCCWLVPDLPGVDRELLLLQLPFYIDSLLPSVAPLIQFQIDNMGEGNEELWLITAFRNTNIRPKGRHFEDYRLTFCRW